MEQNLTERIAQRLKSLRLSHNFSLDQLSALSGHSRATLSRIENGDTSPTAAMLGSLCAAYKISLSRLMAMVEADFAPQITKAQQQIWLDPETGLERILISPPSNMLSAEMLKCTLPAGKSIHYAQPTKQGMEHHLYMLSGLLELEVDGQQYSLKPGDCLRYRLFGASQFKTPKTQSATYIITLI
ncbi:MAG: helix-turn-helix domain-containing protein [Rhizobiales bacterium]|nr:helix-turn-helix domain-containing protein [Hyphomicrobiales bacterium]NRB15286.1 helix-turn-helix domain-containing protein [Hyphomicrobiales bacterium]